VLASCADGPRLPIRSVTGKRQGARDAGTRGQAWTRGGEAGDWDGAMLRKKVGAGGTERSFGSVVAYVVRNV
jgi:hypothetical protein